MNNLNDIALEICAGFKTYFGMKRPALSNINLQLRPGMIHALAGPNGAGKTTLMKVIAGFEPLSKGTLHLNRLSDNNHQQVSLLLDGTRGYISRLTVEQNISYLLALSSRTAKISEEEICKWLERFNLLEKRFSKCSTLSRGMLQRLGLLLAVASESKIILLDEPTNGLDIAECFSFFDLVKSIVKETNSIVVFSSHQPEAILGLADEVSFMKQGIQVDFLSSADILGLRQENFVEKYLYLMNDAKIEILENA